LHRRQRQSLRTGFSPFSYAWSGVDVGKNSDLAYVDTVKVGPYTVSCTATANNGCYSSGKEQVQGMGVTNIVQSGSRNSQTGWQLDWQYGPATAPVSLTWTIQTEHKWTGSVTGGLSAGDVGAVTASLGATQSVEFDKSETMQVNYPLKIGKMAYGEVAAVYTTRTGTISDWSCTKGTSPMPFTWTSYTAPASNIFNTYQ